MYLNGQTIGTIATIIAVAQATIRKVLHRVPPVFFVAVVGTTAPAAVVLPFAAASTPPVRTTIWASARCLSHSSPCEIILNLRKWNFITYMFY